MQHFMNELILPFVEQAKHISEESRTGLQKIHTDLYQAVYLLRSHYKPKPLTDEQAAEQSKIIDERNRLADGRSDIQKCVDAWLKEQLGKHDLKPELLDEDDTESFEYTLTEHYDETRSGCESFTVPVKAKERLEEMDMDFNDVLKDHLDQHCHDDFYIETDYEDMEMTDSETELQ